MDKLEKRLMERLDRLDEKANKVEAVATKLEEMGSTLKNHGDQIHQMQTNINLSMTSLGKVQQEQVETAITLKRSHPSFNTKPPQAGIMGNSPFGMHSPNYSPNVSSLGTPLPEAHDHVPGHGEGAGHSHGGESVKCSWMPKMEFPRFDGSGARIWVEQSQSFFELYQIPAEFQVSAAALYMSGRAAHWYQVYRLDYGVTSWDQFKGAVLQEFDVDVHRTTVTELLMLKQSGSVTDYKQKFEELVYAVKVYDRTVSETMLITQFLLGLKHYKRNTPFSNANMCCKNSK
ncbi:hypothetical protein ACP70R_008673 [Stipagrostis hirtigluma subsp. patula]